MFKINEPFDQICEMAPIKQNLNFKGNTRKRHLPMDDTYSLEVKLAQEAKKIIKLKNENDAINNDLKHSIKTLEADKVIQKENLQQQYSQYEKLERLYQSEFRLREDVLNKINNTRTIQKTLESHSLALHKILATCQEDRQKLSESYQQAIDMLHKMKSNNLKNTKQYQLTIESLQTDLASETQHRLELTNNWNKSNKNTTDFIDQLKERILSLEEIIKSHKIERESEITKYHQIIKQKDELYKSLNVEKKHVFEELTKEINSLKEIKEQSMQHILVLQEKMEGNNIIIQEKEKESINALKQRKEIEDNYQKLQALYESSKAEIQNNKEELVKMRELFEKEKEESQKKLAKNTTLIEEIRQNNILLIKELDDCKENFNNNNIRNENEKLTVEAQLKSMQQKFVYENQKSEKNDENLHIIKAKYDELKVSLETKIENITKENDQLKLEIDEKSSGFTDMMLKLKILMEERAKSEKIIEDYKNKNELLCEENASLKKSASEKNEAKHDQNITKSSKSIEPQKFDIFDEDNWSCQSDSSLDISKYDDIQHLHFESPTISKHQRTKPTKSSTKLLSKNLFAFNLEKQAKYTHTNTKFLKPKVTNPKKVSKK